MKLLPETYFYQGQLSDYCRSGELVDIKGANKDRLPQYRRLVFNVVKSNLENAFPICQKTVGEKIWSEIVFDFFKNHNCRSPYIWKMPLEFVDYARENDWDNKYEKPYLSDLLLFEWLEIELFTREDSKLPGIQEEGHFFENDIVLNPALRLEQFSYPVHHFDVNKPLSGVGNYYILGFRHPESYEVKFMEISPLHVFILNRISSEGNISTHFWNEIESAFHLERSEEITRHVQYFLTEMRTFGVIAGFRKSR